MEEPEETEPSYEGITITSNTIYTKMEAIKMLAESNLMLAKALTSVNVQAKIENCTINSKGRIGIQIGE